MAPLFALFPLQALADTYTPVSMTAADVLAKAQAATGTLEAGRYRIVETVSSAGITWTDTTFSDGDDFRTDRRGAGITMSWGELKGQRWSADENGIVTQIAGFHDNTPNRVALRNPSIEKDRVRVLGASHDENGAIAVEVNPAGGTDQYRYYDPATFLLKKTVTFARDRHRHVAEYRDYRRVYGALVAFTTLSGDERASTRSEERVESMERIPSVDLSMPPSYALFELDKTKPTLLPVDFTPGGVVVRATINGRGVDFLLDSGSDSLTIDPGVAKSLGLTQVGRASMTMGGDVDYGWVRVPEVHVGDLSMHDVVFVSMPHDSQLGQHRVVGLMGFDFFINAITKFDFAHKSVTLFSPATFDPKALGLVAIPAVLDDNVPIVPVQVQGVKGQFLVDTGSFATLMYENFANRVPNLDVRPQEDTEMQAVGGAVRARIVDAHDVVFSDTRIREMSMAQPTTSTFDLQDVDGILGRDLLSQFDIYLDYADSLVFTHFTGGRH